MTFFIVLLFIAGGIGSIWAFLTVEDAEYLAKFDNPIWYQIGIWVGIAACFLIAFVIIGYRKDWFETRGGWASDRKLKKPSKQAAWDALKPNIITGIVFMCAAPVYMWLWGPLYFRTYSNGVDIRALPLVISFRLGPEWLWVEHLCLFSAPYLHAPALCLAHSRHFEGMEKQWLAGALCQQTLRKWFC